jgi:hypothetical protein
MIFRGIVVEAANWPRVPKRVGSTSSRGKGAPNLAIFFELRVTTEQQTCTGASNRSCGQATTDAATATARARCPCTGARRAPEAGGRSSLPRAAAARVVRAQALWTGGR